MLFSHNHDAFAHGSKKYYFHAETAERLDVRVYKSPVDRPSTCGGKSAKSMIITARGWCLPKPVLLARCPGHVDILEVWNPESRRRDKIVRWPHKKAHRDVLQTRIEFLAYSAEKNEFFAKIRRGELSKDVAFVPTRPRPTFMKEVHDDGESPSLATEEQSVFKQVVDQPLCKEDAKTASAVTTAVPAIADIIDLTGDDDNPAQVKQEVIDDNDIKEGTAVFFKSAAGVTARKSPLSEVANARSLHLHFTTAFTLNTNEDVLMLASVNRGRAIRLVSNCKADFDTLWLAIRNDMC